MRTVDRASRLGMALALALSLGWGCSENPLDPDEAIDPEAYFFGEAEPATCDDVCDKLAACFNYDRNQCNGECPQLTPEQRQGVVDATCEEIAAELG